MSNRDTLRLERALAADPGDAVALEALAAARTRAGRGWAGETLPRDLRCSPKERGVYVWTRHGLGLEMVLVPAAPPVAPQDWLTRPGPSQAVAVLIPAAFWVGRYPVTRGEFTAFVRAKPRASQPWDSSLRVGMHDHPVVNVTHALALAFCAWAGLRLPTSAEWTRAARLDERTPCHIPGDPNPHDPSHHRACGICDGEGWLPARLYPWGSLPPTPERCVAARCQECGGLGYTVTQDRGGNPPEQARCEDCHKHDRPPHVPGTRPVRDAECRPARPDGASPCGAMDTVGHVLEFASAGAYVHDLMGASFRRQRQDVGFARVDGDDDVGFRVALSESTA